MERKPQRRQERRRQGGWALPAQDRTSIYIDDLAGHEVGQVRSDKENRARNFFGGCRAAERKDGRSHRFSGFRLEDGDGHVGGDPAGGGGVPEDVVAVVGFKRFHGVPVRAGLWAAVRGGVLGCNEVEIEFGPVGREMFNLYGAAAARTAGDECRLACQRNHQAPKVETRKSKLEYENRDLQRCAAAARVACNSARKSDAASASPLIRSGCHCTPTTQCLCGSCSPPSITPPRPTPAP